MKLQHFTYYSSNSDCVAIYKYLMMVVILWLYCVGFKSGPSGPSGPSGYTWKNAHAGKEIAIISIPTMIMYDL